jgi:solute carrier family 39 (zinc transporter), member 1/2/3
MLSIFLIFIAELVAFRWGSAKLASIGIAADPHGHHGVDGGAHAAHGPEGAQGTVLSEGGAFDDSDHEKHAGSEGSQNGVGGHAADISVVDNALTQIIGVAILEFGVLLHR